jgi:CheY-like chemotaxis protein
MSKRSNKRSPAILVIDDEDYIVDMISEMLAREQYTVYKAYDGRAGLALAEHHNVDLIITDIMMPHMDGNHLVRVLLDKEQTRHIPILMIGAGTYPDNLASNVTFLAKPFNIQTILEFVKGNVFTSNSKTS